MPATAAALGRAGPVFAPVDETMSAPELVPTDRLLSTWAEHDWNQDSGVQLESLRDMERVVVRTYNSVYELVVRSGAQGDVLIRGGKFFPAFTRILLAGSSLGGSFLKRLGIYVGFRMELFLDGETIITSPVTAVSVCTLESGNASGLH